jgi:hypothetical protein
VWNVQYLTGFFGCWRRASVGGRNDDYNHAVAFVLTNSQDKGSDMVPIIAIKTSDGYTSAVITIEDDEVFYL